MQISRNVWNTVANVWNTLAYCAKNSSLTILRFLKIIPKFSLASLGMVRSPTWTSSALKREHQAVAMTNRNSTLLDTHKCEVGAVGQQLASWASVGQQLGPFGHWNIETLKTNWSTGTFLNYLRATTLDVSSLLFHPVHCWPELGVWSQGFNLGFQDIEMRLPKLFNADFASKNIDFLMILLNQSKLTTDTLSTALEKSMQNQEWRSSEPSIIWMSAAHFQHLFEFGQFYHLCKP